MNKALKKSIEAELNSLVTKTLASRNKVATSKIAKHIREGIKNIARKFVKNVPATVKKNVKKTADIKIAASPKKAVKKVSVKKARTKSKK